VSRQENGGLYTPGLTDFGVISPVLQVNVRHPRDVLWAMEEGAACAGLSAVVGEIHGAPSVLDFTATKRLAMRADASGVSVYLIRSGYPGVLSAARERWRVTALPSQRHPYDSQSPGLSQWDVELFRARGRAPGRWVAHYDQNAKQKADRFRLFSRLDDGTVDTGDPSISNSAG
jgi:protein ImuA